MTQADLFAGLDEPASAQPAPPLHVPTEGELFALGKQVQAAGVQRDADHPLTRRWHALLALYELSHRGQDDDAADRD